MESYIIIKNHRKSWKIIKGIFIYLLYFQHVIENGAKRHLKKHRHKPLNNKYFLLFYMIVIMSRVSRQEKFGARDMKVARDAYDGGDAVATPSDGGDAVATQKKERLLTFWGSNATALFCYDASSRLVRIMRRWRRRRFRPFR